jgi:tetratricopeptide (TPR) repeat protein
MFLPFSKTVSLFLLAMLFILFPVVSYGQPSELIESAYSSYADKDWNKSIELFTKLTDENPTHADYAVRLALSYQHARMYQESNLVLNKVLNIGPWPSIYYYQMAINYAKMKDEVNTFRYLQFSIDHGWPHYVNMENDKNFSAYKNTISFNKLFGRTPKDSSSREKKWKADLNFLISRLEVLHYNMYNKTPKGVWDKKVASLTRQLRSLDDSQIVVEFMKIAALAGEGHTKVVPADKGSGAFHAMPITLYHFKNGCYIIEASEAYQALVGQRVLQIGTKKIDELYNLSWKYAGHENSMHHRKMSPRFLVMAETLFDMKAISSLDKITLTTTDSTGLETLTTLNTKTLDEIKKEQAGWIDMDNGSTVPLYLKNEEDDYWFTYLPEKKLFYLSIHYIVNGDRLSFSKFIDSTFTQFDKLGAERLVLDVRNCGGGNSALNRYLLDALITRPQINLENKFFMIIGRNTYSAGINLVDDLEYRIAPTAIGEPTGSSPNFIGESNLLKLPYSQLFLVISNRYHQGGANNSLDKRPWVSPSILIEPVAEDYVQHRDPVMNYILETIH